MKLDEIESTFRSAVKDRFHFEQPTLERALLLSDVDTEATEGLRARVAAMLATAHTTDIEWTVAGPDKLKQVDDVFTFLEDGPPDLIVCYPHLLSNGKGQIHSLGSLVDTVTQATEIPVLLVPSPESGSFESLPASLDEVMVVTNHITGDDRLVSWGAFMCAENGSLFLAHIEDQPTFERYADVISKLARIDTEVATADIREKLLALPSDYIAGVAEVLADRGVHEKVVPLVQMGRPVASYKTLIREHEVDLCVVDSKDASQLAMAQLAYAMAVEIHDLPLLLL